ncbi:protein downstream neighbor of son homolog [Melanotaenia boesemani]|uniref:protein downstream neighbor of son homolog n=1 Tax=Melanotaenia boesemani TaxID=1250792 RepID=UPI001C03D51E|nr:protein downstream neighbor of son homolog [Melanotaenia boesemani]
MDQQTGYSPSFKRPAEIMRMRRKRARSDAAVLRSPSGLDPSDSPGQSSSSATCVRPFSPGPLFSIQNRSGGGTKRRNPFANIENTGSTCSPRKKLFIYNETDKEVETSTQKEEDEATERKRTEAEHQQNRATKSPESPSSIAPSSISPASISPASISPPVCTEYPPDWSLKTRVLFTSPLSLSWTEQPKAQEEAVGLSHSCRAQFFSPPHSLQDPRSCSELRSAFQQSLVYWQHPSLPWLSLFPRINAERSFSGRSTPWAQDVAMQQSLMREWSVSLSSLYNLLKSRLCPYFYLCSYQFTVLFRAAGLAGSGNITALISPTTRGFREAMKAEGIEFSLPLVEKRKRSRDPHNLMADEGEEDEEEGELRSQQEEGEDDGGDEDGSFSWLKEMGVQDKIQRPDGITIQLRKEAHSVCVDHKPESVVCVEGPHTFTLINFLINWKGVVAAAGSQAGLPPTLLAPAAFRGATMHMLKVRSVNAKSQVGSTYQNISSLELTGPILPSSLHAITTLLRPAQKGNFSAVLYTHPPSAVMNVNSRNQQCADLSVDLSGCGLRPASIQQLQQPSSLGKTALTHVTMNDYGYAWKN